jgi:hypothetical protein
LKWQECIPAEHVLSSHALGLPLHAYYGASIAGPTSHQGRSAPAVGGSAGRGADPAGQGPACRPALRQCYAGLSLGQCLKCSTRIIGNRHSDSNGAIPQDIPRSPPLRPSCSLAVLYSATEGLLRSAPLPCGRSRPTPCTGRWCSAPFGWCPAPSSPFSSCCSTALPGSSCDVHPPLSLSVSNAMGWSGMALRMVTCWLACCFLLPWVVDYVYPVLQSLYALQTENATAPSVFAVCHTFRLVLAPHWLLSYYEYGCKYTLGSYHCLALRVPLPPGGGE